MKPRIRLWRLWQEKGSVIASLVMITEDSNLGQVAVVRCGL